MSRDRPVRILQSVGAMNHGGIEHFLMNLYRGINRDLVQFDFIERVNGPAIFDEEIASLGGRIFHCASPDKHPIRAMRYYRSFFRKHPEYSVVHEHRSSLLGFMGCLTAASYENVSTRIIHAHNSSPVRSGAARAAEMASDSFNKRRVKKFATDYFACSDAAKAWMFPVSTGVSDKVKVIPNGIDTKRFRFDNRNRSDIRREFKIPQHAFVIGHVGRFDCAKNQSFLLDILASFPEEDRPVLLLLGDGALRVPLEERACSMGLEGNVVFAGMQNETNRFYSAMDIFCMPSLYEGLPVSAVEAQANGLPLLLSDGISRDTDLGGGVEFKALSDGPMLWAEVLSEQLKSVGLTDRAEGVTRVVEAGFDIGETANTLQDFYIDRSTLAMKMNANG